MPGLWRAHRELGRTEGELVVVGWVGVGGEAAEFGGRWVRGCGCGWGVG